MSSSSNPPFITQLLQILGTLTVTGLATFGILTATTLKLPDQGAGRIPYTDNGGVVTSTPDLAYNSSTKTIAVPNIVTSSTTIGAGVASASAVLSSSNIYGLINMGQHNVDTPAGGTGFFLVGYDSNNNGTYNGNTYGYGMGAGEFWTNVAAGAVEGHRNGSTLVAKFTQFGLEPSANGSNSLGIATNAFGALNVVSASATTLTLNGTSVLPNLSASTISFGNASLAAGACTSTATTVTGATTAMAVVATPVTYPGDGTFWEAYVSGSNTVTTKVCDSIIGTPTASIYRIRVIQ